MRVMRAIAAAVLAAGCGDSTGPEDVDFSWSGTVDQGDAIEIKGVNGSISAVYEAGDDVSVTAVKDGQVSDPDGVTIVVVPHADGVTICAVYPDVAGQPSNECQPGSGGHLGTQNNDVEVDFTVRVPAGVAFIGTTVNGGVLAEQLRSNVFATTVNGDVVVTTTGIALASVVNGAIDVAIATTTWDRDLTYTAVNGNVSVEVPAAANADVSLTTANGTIASDFALTEVGPGNWQGVIGSGVWGLTLTTVNGNVDLQRGS
jgi:hypothetical protein